MYLAGVVEASHYRLLTNLFSHYDKRIRPFADNGTAVQVHMSIVLGILIEMKENEQVASYVISHTQRWLDPKLAWNPHKYNNIRELIVPQSMLWLPKLFVYNSMSTKEMLTDEKYDVRIQSDGQVKINIPQYVKCICRLSIEQFPFDTQFCAVALASPLLTVEEMDVDAHMPPKDSYFAGNAEWKLINISVRHMKFLEEGEYRAEVHYIFHLRRRPIFYITVIVVPIFLISTLSILGIFTPGSNEGPRSEKVSLGLGSLLAMTVLLGIVAGAMPKSNSIPLLGYYILVVIILCALAVGVSMTFLTIGRRLVEKARIPSNFTYRLMFITPRLSPCFGNSAIHLCSLNSPKRKVSHRKSLMSRDSQMLIKPTAEDDLVFFQLKQADHATFPKLRNGTGGSIILPPNGRVSGAADKTNSRKKDVHKQPSTENSVPTPEDYIAHLTKIETLLSYLADSHRATRRKLEREKNRELIEREWSRVFIRLDYLCLLIFQLMNVLALFFFLQYAWVKSPEMREPLV
ncbi:neurotransmitter-gated ion-channel ligand binding domain-containing protein [Ditylenchus destructor]|uniref:Neurotransmitter-gated ion-channel ligand binding domain-containing protein n=1 Tax=Ditylenchus destructor TaxID=166010 RepID=A0AAD4MUU2_9BILA|nr:neurotransmitter-gated ion-channel ligand binding domain-containing protein [Ditylenchus destructor]